MSKISSRESLGVLAAGAWGTAKPAPVTDDKPPVWVDDILAAYHPSLKREFDEFVKVYNKTYEVKVLGPTTIFSGIQVDRDRQNKTVKLHQTIYRTSLEEKFGKFIVPGTPNTTPVSYVRATSDARHFENISFAADDDERKKMKEFPYMSLYASLLFTMCMTCPDIAFALAGLGRYIGDPSLAAWAALIQVLAYVVKHKSDGLTFGGPISAPSFFNDAAEYRRSPSIWITAFVANLGLYVVSDASWKVNHTYAGFVVMFVNAAVDWASKLVKVICHSSMESEIASGCFAGKRYMLIRSLVNEICSMCKVTQAMITQIRGPIIFCIDNSATKDHTQDEGVKAKTEHFLRWQHYLRWLVSHGYAVVFWVATKNQPVDFMTKPVDLTTFLRGRAIVVNIPYKHACYIVLDNA